MVFICHIYFKCSTNTSFLKSFCHCNNPTGKYYYYPPISGNRASLVAQTVKRPPGMWETQVGSLGWEDPLGKEMETHSGILAWKIPWTEEPGRLQSMGSVINWGHFFLNVYELFPSHHPRFIRKYLQTLFVSHGARVAVSHTYTTAGPLGLPSPVPTAPTATSSQDLQVYCSEPSPVSRPHISQLPSLTSLFTQRYGAQGILLQSPEVYSSYLQRNWHPVVKALPNGRWKLLINSSSFPHSKKTVLRCSFAQAGSLRQSKQEHWVETSSVTPAPVPLSPSLPSSGASQVSHFCSLALGAEEGRDKLRKAAVRSTYP